MKTIKLTIKGNEEAQEILISQLEDMGVNGFEQTEFCLLAYFFETEYPRQKIEELLRGVNYKVEIIPEQNWNKVWENNFEPVQIGSFCTIRSEFHSALKTEYDLVITPKMSFGTGHHATTYMMVEQMAGIDFNNKTVLDFGTGTGVLAILAEKMGAKEIFAIDIDAWSISNAKENASKNECKKIEILHDKLIPDYEFDVILANINRNTLLSSLPDMKRHLRGGGQLLMSGLLELDNKELIKACELNHLKLMKGQSKSGWVSLLFDN